METITLAYLLLLLGLALLVAEIFIPSGGVLLALAVVALLVGVTLCFSVSTTTGLLSLLGIFLVLPMLLFLWLYIFPRTPIGRKYFLQAPEEDSTLADSPTIAELEKLRGRYGKTVSALRPAGVTDFDGKRVDTLSEGSLIGPGEWVQCIDVQAGKVIVRKVEAPAGLEDFDPNQLEHG